MNSSNIKLVFGKSKTIFVLLIGAGVLIYLLGFIFSFLMIKSNAGPAERILGLTFIIGFPLLYFSGLILLAIYFFKNVVGSQQPETEQSVNKKEYQANTDVRNFVSESIPLTNEKIVVNPTITSDKDEISFDFPQKEVVIIPNKNFKPAPSIPPPVTTKSPTTSLPPKTKFNVPFISKEENLLESHSVQSDLKSNVELKKEEVKIEKISPAANEKMEERIVIENKIVAQQPSINEVKEIFSQESEPEKISIAANEEIEEQIVVENEISVQQPTINEVEEIFSQESELEKISIAANEEIEEHIVVENEIATTQQPSINEVQEIFSQESEPEKISIDTNEKIEEHIVVENEIAAQQTTINEVEEIIEEEPAIVNLEENFVATPSPIFDVNKFIEVYSQVEKWASAEISTLLNISLQINFTLATRFEKFDVDAYGIKNGITYIIEVKYWPHSITDEKIKNSIKDDFAMFLKLKSALKQDAPLKFVLVLVMENKPETNTNELHEYAAELAPDMQLEIFDFNWLKSRHYVTEQSLLN